MSIISDKIMKVLIEILQKCKTLQENIIIFSLATLVNVSNRNILKFNQENDENDNNNNNLNSIINNNNNNEKKSDIESGYEPGQGTTDNISIHNKLKLKVDKNNNNINLNNKKKSISMSPKKKTQIIKKKKKL
jgi:hypothetical protein